MKLKYKKIIMLTIMSTMGIGVLTLSVSQDSPKVEESLSTKATVEAEMIEDNSVTDNNTTGVEANSEIATLSIPAPSPTVAPTPTAYPVYEIEKDAYPKIDQLIKDYYMAKNTRDIDKLKALLSDPAEIYTLDELQKITEYIEDYKKIKTYTKKSVETGTYIVYVYYEIKFTSINTPAPSLAKFYIVTGEGSQPKIFFGELDEAIKVYFDERDTDEDVVALIEMTNEQSQEAMDKDEDLLNFWKSIDELANGTQETPEAEGDSAE